MEILQVFPPSPSAWPASGERFEQLLQSGQVRIERILSAPGSRSGPYDQAHDEWVLLLRGHAVLQVADQRVELTQGQALWLPAHVRHSVLDTSSEPPCLWLAVHIEAPSHTCAD